LFRGNGVTLRTRRVIQGDDNGHVGRPGEVSLAPPCPELCCELRGLCRHSYLVLGTSDPCRENTKNLPCTVKEFALILLITDQFLVK
jgi:hypothetical protein